MTTKMNKPAKPSAKHGKRLGLSRQTLRNLGVREQGPKGGGSKSRQGIGC